MATFRDHAPLASALSMALGLAAPATAQDSTGTITGMYRADTAVWVIGEGLAPDVPDSGWRETEDGLEVTMAADPGAEEMGIDGPMLVTMTIGTSPEARLAQDVQVVVRSDARDQPLIADPETIDITITALEIEEDSMAIAGDLVATMAPDGTGPPPLDAEQTWLFDGNFQATLMRYTADDTSG